MNHILAFKEKVKRIIEAHGGAVDIGVIDSIYRQPTELQDKYLLGNIYAPIEILFDGEHLKIHIDGGGYFPPATAREYLKRLQAAIAILEEIENNV